MSGCFFATQCRYITVWSGISSYCILFLSTPAVRCLVSNFYTDFNRLEQTDGHNRAIMFMVLLLAGKLRTMHSLTRKKRQGSDYY